MTKTPTALNSVTTGDIGDSQTLTLDGVDNLDNLATIAATVTRGDTTAALTVTVVDSATAQVRIDWGASDGWLATAAPGLWIGQIAGQFNDGADWTWPKGSAFTVNVGHEVG